MEQGWGMREITPACPRCGSSNTKFCYYNNYSLTQPRYFCKGCRRYWTKGGSLRNIPVGGGCRKSRRCNRSSSSSSSHLRMSNELTSQHLESTNRTMMMMSSSNSSPPSSSSTSNSNIDLAVVYANFLNQKRPHVNDRDRSHHQVKPLGSSDQLLLTGHEAELINCTSSPPFDISRINLHHSGTIAAAANCMFNSTTTTANSSGNGGLLTDHHLYLDDEELNHHHHHHHHHHHQTSILHHHTKRPPPPLHTYNEETTILPNLLTSHTNQTFTNGVNVSLPPLPGEEAGSDVTPAPFDDHIQWERDSSHRDSDHNYGNGDNSLQSITDHGEKMEPAAANHDEFNYSSFIRDCWSPIDFTCYSHDHHVQTSNGSVSAALTTPPAATVLETGHDHQFGQKSQYLPPFSPCTLK